MIIRKERIWNILKIYAKSIRKGDRIPNYKHIYGILNAISYINCTRNRNYTFIFTKWRKAYTTHYLELPSHIILKNNTRREYHLASTYFVCVVSSVCVCDGVYKVIAMRSYSSFAYILALVTKSFWLILLSSSVWVYVRLCLTLCIGDIDVWLL